MASYLIENYICQSLQFFENYLENIERKKLCCNITNDQVHLIHMNVYGTKKQFIYKAKTNSSLKNSIPPLDIWWFAIYVSTLSGTPSLSN